MSAPEIRGFTSVTAFVSILDDWDQELADALGWQRRQIEALSPDECVFWNLHRSTVARVVELANPSAEHGVLRLIQVEGSEAQRIRPDVAPWHMGGLFDANARVRDIAQVYRDLTALGWRGLTEPTRFVFGPFTVQEVLMEGPDGVVLAFIERVAPPLKGWPHLRVASRLFNSTQTVRDLDAALDFYVGVLGFETYLEHDGASPPPGANVLGLDPETAQQVVRRVRIVHPQGLNDGSVELIEFVEHPGEDFAARSDPPGLGLAALTFPCTNVLELAAHLTAHGHPPVSGPVRLRQPDGAEPLHLAVRAPDGAWLVFVEVPPP